MSEWTQYADQVVNRFNYETNAWDKTNCCTVASIYGHDGSLWTDSSQGGCNLTTYQHEIEDLDGNKKNIEVNEVNCALAATNNNRQPTQAGIRLGGLKHMLTYHDETTMTAKLNASGGGASVGQTKTAVIVAFWKKDQKDSAGGNQSADECWKLVSEMTAYLTEQGY